MYCNNWNFCTELSVTVSFLFQFSVKNKMWFALQSISYDSRPTCFCFAAYTFMQCHRVMMQAMCDIYVAITSTGADPDIGHGGGLNFGRFFFA